MALDSLHGVRLSQTSPAFLHANSTSHTWTFSAIAELVDNAYDPDVSAENLWIDKKFLSNCTCITFTDDGSGCAPDKLHKMLSFGYCEKVDLKGHKPIGHYGNGFKSGSMRLGKDAIIFTKSKTTMSVGFLSQTFLEAINAETVLVPIVTWHKDSYLLDKEAPDAKGSLEIITRHSLFRSEKELMQEFKSIRASTGTRIIIYTLKKGSDGKFELDFESDKTDIINSGHQELDFAGGLLSRPIREHMPEYGRSLREYLSILYLKPKMKITLRGSRVKTKLVKKSLSKTRKTTYTPSWMLSQGKKGVDIFFGFGPSKQDFGCMMYHRNRLIKAYEHVGYQKQANVVGVGVVGVVEVDFLEPIHNKQDFSKTDRYNACMTALGLKLNQYWNMMMQNTDEPEALQENPPDWTWVQCELCLKWRRLPDEFKDELPEKWYCRLNTDMSHNRCDIDEEPEDEDEVFRLVVSKNANNINSSKKGPIISPPPNIISNNFQNAGPGRPPLRQDPPVVISPLGPKPNMSQGNLSVIKQQIRSPHPQPGPSGHGNPGMKRRGTPLNIAMFNRNRKQPIKKEFINVESDDEDDTTPSKRLKMTRRTNPPRYTETRNTDGFAVVVLESSDEEMDNDKTRKERKRPTSPVEIKPSINDLEGHSGQTDDLIITGESGKSSRRISEQSRKVARKHTAPRRGSTPRVYTDIADDPALVNDLATETSTNSQSAEPEESPSTSHKSRKTDKTNTQATSVRSEKTQSDDKVVIVTNTEVEEGLREQLASTKNELNSLRCNIQELLKILVPDLKLENPEIVDRVIVEMIHVNAEQGQLPENKNEADVMALTLAGVSTAEKHNGPTKDQDPETKVEKPSGVGDLEDNGLPAKSTVSDMQAEKDGNKDDQPESLDVASFSSNLSDGAGNKGKKSGRSAPVVFTDQIKDGVNDPRPPSNGGTLSSDSEVSEQSTPKPQLPAEDPIKTSIDLCDESGTPVPTPGDANLDPLPTENTETKDASEEMKDESKQQREEKEYKNEKDEEVVTAACEEVSVSEEHGDTPGTGETTKEARATEDPHLDGSKEELGPAANSLAGPSEPENKDILKEDKDTGAQPFIDIRPEVPNSPEKVIESVEAVKPAECQAVSNVAESEEDKTGSPLVINIHPQEDESKPRDEPDSLTDGDLLTINGDQRGVLTSSGQVDLQSDSNLPGLADSTKDMEEDTSKVADSTKDMEEDTSKVADSTKDMEEDTSKVKAKVNTMNGDLEVKSEDTNGKNT